MENEIKKLLNEQAEAVGGEFATLIASVIALSELDNAEISCFMADIGRPTVLIAVDMLSPNCGEVIDAAYSVVGA